MSSIMDKTKKPSRRNFLIGMATGAGVAAVAMGTMGRAGRNAVQETEPEAAPAETVLYRRTAEAERYYKTLYT